MPAPATRTPSHMVRHTLDKMARGGIYDHLGGGFARYSTDARWLVPHFEKMLYDNALLASAYLEAYQATRGLEVAGELGPAVGRQQRRREQVVLAPARLPDRRDHPGGDHGGPLRAAGIDDEHVEARLGGPPRAGEPDQAAADDDQLRAPPSRLDPLT